LRDHGRASLDGHSGGDAFRVFHPVGVVLKGFHWGFEFFRLGGLQTRFEFGQAEV